MIKYTHNIQNHRIDLGKKGPGFEVNCSGLAVPLYWWNSWFITMKCIELAQISYKTRWEEVRDKDDTGIILVSNSSTTLANNLLPNTDICND